MLTLCQPSLIGRHLLHETLSIASSLSFNKPICYPQTLTRLTPVRQPIRCLKRQTNGPGLLTSGLATDIVNRAPPPLQPYLRLARLDRPIGNWLIYLPGTWGIAMATPAGCLPDPGLLILFGAGAIAMRAAGCTINDMWDREIDAKVERTKGRPIASGEISYGRATCFLASQLSLSLALLCQLNWQCMILGVACLPLVIAYPLCKRITYWPQITLGLTLNWGLLMGYASVAGHLSWPVVVPLYLFAVLWTMTYDTVYSHQDKEDDRSIGVKSTALLLGDTTKLWASGWLGVMTSALCLAGANAGSSSIYYVTCGLTIAHIARQLYTVDLNDNDSCMAMFKSTRNAGLLLFTGISLDRFFL